MTNMKSTKKALITSALCLLLCVSMLVGATFAWFTDSVSTTNNVIKAGNLDVELEWSTDGKTWTSVEADTNVFLKDALWEPGHTEVVYLKVSNLGTLALKYQLGVNVYNEIPGTNVADETFKLSDYILYNVYEGFEEYVDSAAARGDESGNKLNVPYNKAAQLLNTGDSVVLTMVVFMPTTVGNEANYQTGTTAPVINLGINLFATQYVKEEDSYGPDYDGSIAWNGSVDTAWYDADATELVIGSAEQLAGFAKLVNEGTSFAGKTVKLDSNIDLANLPWTPISSAEVDDSVFVGFQGTFDGQGYTIANLNVADDTWGLGLFGYMGSKNVVVKNVNVHNATVNATDCAGIIVGYTTYGTFSNIHVTGDVVVSGSSADGHVGGIAGCGYYASFDNCSVSGATITSNGSFNGGIVGYQCANTKAITNCKVTDTTITGDSSVGGIAGIIASGTTFSGNAVENVVLTKTRVGGFPKVGAFIGCYDGSKDTALADCSVKNVTLNGANEAYAAYNALYGAGYDANAAAKFDVTTVTVDGITNNLTEVTKANNAADLDAALKAGEDVVLGGNLKFNASATTANSGYGATGVSVFGNTLDGNGYSLGINDWGTWASAINITSGTVKNLTVNSGMRGIFINHNGAAGKVYLENVIVDGTVYTISCDQGTNNGLEATNCTFNGWTSYAATIGDVLFVDCSFGAGQGYNFSRPYAPTTYVGCEFAAGHQIDARAAITFENCTINGEPLTAENLSTLVTGGIANATVK